MIDAWSPLRLRSGHTLRNRFVIAPMTTDAANADGSVSEEELEFIRRRALTGFGAMISSCAYVQHEGRSWHGIGAAEDGQISSLSRVAAAMHADGGLAILQLYDGGRIARPTLAGERGLRAPSAIASLRPGAPMPREMSAEEIERLIDDFRKAARRGRELASTESKSMAPIIITCISSSHHAQTSARTCGEAILSDA
jgi:2,4-dienoyl-CoA reductase-like NADH-dependent reductase (Old Yellow Enzyme family)